MGIAIAVASGVFLNTTPGLSPISGSGLWSMPAQALAATGTQVSPALVLLSTLGITYVQGPVVAAGTTPPAVTLTGTPATPTNTIVITITLAGIVGVAQFSWSLNGVTQQTGQTVASTFLLGSTGITANFPAGTYNTVSTPDTYTSVVTSSTWADQSGNGHNAAQATAANQMAYSAVGGPNGQPALLGNGSSAYMAAGTNLGIGTGNWTMFTVQQITTPATVQGFFHVGTATVNGMGLGTISSNRDVRCEGVANMSDAACTTSWEQWTIEANAGTTSLRVNGSGQTIISPTSAYTTPAALYEIGRIVGVGYLGGGFAAALVYDSALSAANVLAVEAFLSNIYGV